MTPLLLFWPLWFIMAIVAAAGFVKDASFSNAYLLLAWAVLGGLQSLNTWREIRKAAGEWMNTKEKQ